jgi:predicted RNase H-like nuclease (RuvC/YqgF family)
MERNELRERCAEQGKTIADLRCQLDQMSQEAETHEKERTEVGEGDKGMAQPVDGPASRATSLILHI